MDPRLRALEELDSLLARSPDEPLESPECTRLVELSRGLPGRLRAVSSRLARERSPAAVEALLALPADTPSQAEGVYAALTRGVARRLDDEAAPAPHSLAIEFRRSTSKEFPATLARARRAFGEKLEALEHGRRRLFRVELRPEELSPERLIDLRWLHERTLRRAGTRTWINGWVFDDDGPLKRSTRALLAEGWMGWARGR